MSGYFVSRGDLGNEGPLDEAEVVRRMESGEISREDLLCKEGWEEWKPAAACIHIQSTRPTTIVVQTPPPPRERPGAGALIGGVICLVVGLVASVIPFPLFYLYVPLFLAAFALSIVTLAQKRIGAGIALMLGTLGGAPLAVVVGWAIAGGMMASILATGLQRDATNSIAYLTNLVVYETETSIRKDVLDGEVRVVSGKIRNAGPQTVNRAVVTAYFLGNDTRPISEESFLAVTSVRPLRSGYIEEFAFKAKRVPSEWAGSLNVTVTDADLANSTPDAVRPKP